MDVSSVDPQGAMRQRFLEIDERTEAVRETVTRSTLSWTEFQEMYDISWIYHENGLEGVVLGYAEIKSAVDNKIISDVSLLPTYESIKAQKACMDLIREKAQNRRFAITVPFLKEMHATLVEPEEVGQYRPDIPIHRTYFHEIAQPAKIPVGLQKVLDYLKARHDNDMHPIELAANVHHRFMRVFPFANHSGFIGRLIANFVLSRHGYLPLVIHATDRQHYYEALRGPERDFKDFVATTMDNALANAMKFLANISQGSSAPSSKRASA